MTEELKLWEILRDIDYGTAKVGDKYVFHYDGNIRRVIVTKPYGRSDPNYLRWGDNDKIVPTDLVSGYFTKVEPEWEYVTTDRAEWALNEGGWEVQRTTCKDKTRWKTVEKTSCGFLYWKDGISEVTHNSKRAWRIRKKTNE